MPKTIAGAMQIAYDLEPIVIQGWIDHLTYENGVFSFYSGVEFNEPVTFDDAVTVNDTLIADAIIANDYLTVGNRITGEIGTNSAAIGGNNIASGIYSLAQGIASHAVGSCSSAQGYSVTAVADYAHAEGYGSHARGVASHAEGTSNIASGKYSHAEGNTTKAIGESSHAEGQEAQAKGFCSHAEGNGSVANGASSHAEGAATSSVGDGSHAEGHLSKSSGYYSHAEGYNSKATGTSTHAEGDSTKATGTSSHAEGCFSTASGLTSHAEGFYTEASGPYAHAEGLYTIAAGAFQHVFGRYNVSDNYNIEIVGNGDSTTRRNIRTLSQQGDETLAGHSMATEFMARQSPLSGMTSNITTYSVEYINLNGSDNLTFPVGKSGTFALTSDVATAKTEAINEAVSQANANADAKDAVIKQQAISEAVSTSDSHLNDALYDLHHNDQTLGGNVTIGGNLTVGGTMTSVDTQTISTHERYIQMMKGNTVAVSGYTGLVWPKYDAVDDFFLGLQGDVNVLGKVTATFNEDGDVIAVTPISLIPLTGRADEQALTNGNLVKWDATAKKIIDAGLNVDQEIQAEAGRVQAENGRVQAETQRTEVFDARNAAMPFPISYADYLHLKDDAYWYNVYIENGEIKWSVDSSEMVGAIFSAQYSTRAVYPLTNDPEFSEKMATCDEAAEYIGNQVFVTDEQYAELEQEGLIDPDKNYYIYSDDLYDLLIQAGEQEPIRQENEEIRQANLEADIISEGYPITEAEYNTLMNGGRFGVHFNNGEKVVTVYASQALAEQANETYIFPIQDNIQYPAEGISGDSPYLNIPAPPQADGNYVLKCSVVSGAITYTWEAQQ